MTPCVGCNWIKRRNAGRRHYNAMRRDNAEMRRTRVAKLLLEQMCQVDMAKRIGVSPATISRDVRAINRELMEAAECPVCGSPYVPWLHKAMYPALYDDFVEPERVAGHGAVSTGQVGNCAASQDDAAAGEAPEATPLPTVKELEERRRAIMGRTRRRRTNAEKAPEGLDAMDAPPLAGTPLQFQLG